jgi:hypothetical protein
MLRCPFALTILLALSLNANAREAHPAAGVTPEANVSLSEQALKQKRRDGLREAFKLPVEGVPAPSRQMSAEEKAELREQLRQQRLDLLK